MIGQTCCLPTPRPFPTTLAESLHTAISTYRLEYLIVTVSPVEDSHSTAGTPTPRISGVCHSSRAQGRTPRWHSHIWYSQPHLHYTGHKLYEFSSPCEAQQFIERPTKLKKQRLELHNNFVLKVKASTRQMKRSKPGLDGKQEFGP